MGVLTTILVVENASVLPGKRRRLLSQKNDLSNQHRSTKKCLEPVNEDVAIDHIVIRSSSIDRAKESMLFWKSNFGFDVEREQEAADFALNDRNEVAFPSVRVTESTTIDLYYSNMRPFYSPNAKNDGSLGTGDSVVDRVSLTLSGKRLLDVLTRFEANGVVVERFVGDYFGRDKDNKSMFWGPWGARGVGMAVFLFEPNGVYLELRSYDLDYLSKIREQAEKLSSLAKEKEKSNGRRN